MLRRIPAVKWAFTRLRPAAHGGSVDATATAADVSPVIAEATAAQDVAAEDVASKDVAETATADSAEISTVSVRAEAEMAAAAPSAQNDTAISIIAESPPAAPTDAGVSEDSSRQISSDTEPVVAAEASAAEIETAAEHAPEPAISNDPAMEVSTEAEPSEVELIAVEAVSEPVEAAELISDSDPLPSEGEPVVTAETSPPPVDVENAPLDAPAIVVDHDHSLDVIVDVEPAVSEPCATSADAEVLAPTSENHCDSAPSPGEAVAIEPVAVEIAAPVAATAAADVSTEAASVVTDIAPAPALVSPSPEVRSAPKVRSRPTEPADRAALIRQRWAESGIRMWNPRLHGTGEATLNIQGSIGLLPPAPGETMPRYDKLEFRMLGGQIVCEGVIVEAPAQASHRSFTQLAEPAKPERAREPARERQAALA
ncbi:MAG: hypothetical protein EKK33_15505 [Bradyrhizobiaceae bacterium]|nr:MAG: hypothetical protein EKK33_15505 [Bradyrhizobiaceae bacterium]